MTDDQPWKVFYDETAKVLRADVCFHRGIRGGTDFKEAPSTHFLNSKYVMINLAWCSQDLDRIDAAWDAIADHFDIPRLPSSRELITKGGSLYRGDLNEVAA